MAKKAMKLSEKGIRHIKDSEGRRYEAYPCEAGVWTIGLGHTRGVKRGDRATDEQIDKWFREDIVYFERIVNEYVTAELTQDQFDVLVSLVFNIGEGSFLKSQTLREINKDPNSAKVAKEMSEWRLVEIGGIKVASQGLVNRREKEAAIYFGTEAGETPGFTYPTQEMWELSDSVHRAHGKEVNTKGRKTGPSKGKGGKPKPSVPKEEEVVSSGEDTPYLFPDLREPEALFFLQPDLLPFSQKEQIRVPFLPGAPLAGIAPGRWDKGMPSMPRFYMDLVKVGVTRPDYTPLSADPVKQQESSFQRNFFRPEESKEQNRSAERPDSGWFIPEPENNPEGGASLPIRENSPIPIPEVPLLNVGQPSFLPGGGSSSIPANRVILPAATPEELHFQNPDKGGAVRGERNVLLPDPSGKNGTEKNYREGIIDSRKGKGHRERDRVFAGDSSGLPGYLRGFAGDSVLTGSPEIKPEEPIPGRAPGMRLQRLDILPEFRTPDFVLPPGFPGGRTNTEGNLQLPETNRPQPENNGGEVPSNGTIDVSAALTEVFDRYIKDSQTV